MSPPRVLLVSKGLDIGGIERVVVDLASGLARRDVPVEVAVMNNARAGLAGVLADAGVPVRGLGGTDHLGLAATRRLRRLATAGSYDVLHVHGPLPAVPLRILRRRPPLVTTSHTMWRALRAPVRLAWHLTSRFDAAGVAVSAAVAASLPRSIAVRTRVIPHGVDPLAVVAAARARRDRAPGQVVAVTVASHRDAKNYPNLLRGLRRARELGAAVRLRAVGEGPQLERHRQLVLELGLGDVVDFEPPAPDVLSTIAAADLLVVASDFEGQPLVVGEALALGVPVVATAVGRVPELVTTGVGRVVAPNDADALGRAIAELAGDPALRARMGAAAREVGLRWTLDDVVDAHLGLYQEVSGR